MFDGERIYISALRAVDFVEAARHTKSRSVFADNIPLPRYELIYKIGGENITVFNGKSLHTLPGCVYYLPKCKNAHYYVDRIKCGDCIDIHFDTDYPLAEEALMINCETNMKLQPLFESIYRIWIAKKDGYYYKCMAIFYEILEELRKNSVKYLPSDKYKLIEKGVEYIHAHYFDEEISLLSLSEICGISYSYFKRLFIERFGISPQAYLTKLKTDRAKELLSVGRYSATEISQMCGFKNVYYFSRVFKNETGMSPSEYRHR